MADTLADPIEIRFAPVTPGGREKAVRVERGTSILDAARTGGLEMDATCGARGRCRSCRVKILKGEVPPPTVQDTIQLGHEEVQERFRLGCQTRPVVDCAVMPMPPRAEAGHQILGGGGRREGATLTVDSGVRKHLVKARAPTEEHHQTSDIDEVLSALGEPVDHRVPLAVLRKLPAALRKESGRLTVTTFLGRILDSEVIQEIHTEGELPQMLKMQMGPEAKNMKLSIGHRLTLRYEQVGAKKADTKQDGARF